MGNPTNKLATWRNWVIVLLALGAAAAYNLYRSYDPARGFDKVRLVATAITLAIGLLIAASVFWYANRPERGDKP